MKIAILGNCQIESIEASLRVLVPDAHIQLFHVWNVTTQFSRNQSLIEHLRNFDLVLSHRFYDLVGFDFDELKQELDVLEFPALNFAAFHPDCVYLVDDKTHKIVRSCLGDYNSALIAFCFANGLTKEQCLSAFRESVFSHVGYFSMWDNSVMALDAELQRCGLKVGNYIPKWMAVKPFMNSINHPKIFAINDILIDMLATRHIATRQISGIDDYSADPLINYAKWPIYPELASYFGVQGGYTFKSETKMDGQKYIFGLSEFIEDSYTRYAALEVEKFRNDMLAIWGGMNLADLIRSQ
ncbi:WcbI family polysaccharide biosynthesis putative acetyltransferase [Allorhizobium terrae]|uniref:Polysaccharide biosynthesis enzyme WcbI domain-containing protein n=1 Tax=Allorhizobium terrae TaxID=1848972 RepID=A0A4V6RWR4_9HYPH|nr:WcbI family polysaccharide biosynthesis putative acetyltransferase [Allorhizobium terrae]THF48084.1 hypothetical protein E6C51_16600 [Allorhizobium terrae]